MRKFYEIYLDLAQKIKDREYEPGKMLPIEVSLAKQYNVSRETIRKAQALLVENGYIQKKQGRGATVLDIQKLRISGSSLAAFNEIQKQPGGSKTYVLKNKKERIQKELAEIGSISEREEVIAIERLRKVQDEAVILEKDFLLVSIAGEVPMEEAKSSLFQFIENSTGKKVGYSHRELTIEPVTEEDVLLLDLGTDSHVAVVRSKVYLEDTRLFQFHESRHRVDTIRYIDLARRGHQEHA